MRKEILICDKCGKKVDCESKESGNWILFYTLSLNVPMMYLSIKGKDITINNLSFCTLDHFIEYIKDTLSDGSNP